MKDELNGQRDKGMKTRGVKKGNMVCMGQKLFSLMNELASGRWWFLLVLKTDAALLTIQT